MGRWQSWNTSHRAALVVAVLAIVVVATGTMASLQPGASAPPTSPGASAAATAATTATPASTPSPTEAPWADLEVPDLPRLADLTPLKQDGTGLALDSGFAVESVSGGSAVAIAKRVSVTPQVRLAVSGDAQRAFLTPSAPLAPGTAYRFTLNAPDGTLQGSWVYRTRSPVRVLSTTPGDRLTGVPVDTGIEVTFDQDGVAAMDHSFSIVPAVSGRFERHGRTQVFVPDGLKTGTLYTVTVKAGLERTGTDLKLAKDVVFRFETASVQVERVTIQFGRETVETSPREAPVVAVEVLAPDGVEKPSSVDVVVRRYPDEAAAASALRAFLAAPRWTQFSYPTLETKGLPTVATFTARLEAMRESSSLLRFPEALPVGWYAIEIVKPVRVHAFLQVTPVSAWTAVLTDRTVVWVNDVVAATPIEGATVSLVGGATIATTDAQGVANGPTPASLIPPAGQRSTAYDDPRSQRGTAPLLAIHATSGSVLVPFDVRSDPTLYRGEWWEQYSDADGTYWSLLYTDRQLYRRSDRIEAWGYMRGRDDGSVPRTVSLQLFDGNGWREGAAPIVSSAVTPTASGAFVGGLSFDTVPYGWYNLAAVVDGRVIATTYLSIGAIHKPLYRLELTSDHSAVLTGSTVRLTASATFFDGSPAVGVPIRFRASDGVDQSRVTDASGRATIEVVAAYGNVEYWSDESWREWGAWVEAESGESGEIYAQASVAVFPSTLNVAATATLKGTDLSIAGTVVTVDIPRIDRERAAGTWTGEVYGAPAAGRTVQARVIELIPVKTQTGTTYDYLQKKAIPVYEYRTDERPVRSVALTTSSVGKVGVTVAVPSVRYQYRVLLTALDAAQRESYRQVFAGPQPADMYIRPGITFETSAGKPPDTVAYAVGEPISWRMVESGEPVPQVAGDRFLYLVAQRGLLDVSTSADPTFERAFRASDAPGIFVIGVRFVGTTYAPKAAEWAVFKETTRALHVALSTDRSTYRPGDDMTLTIRTTDAAGRASAAQVVVQAVDEKLFAMGAASVPEALSSLYRKVDSGIVRLSSTHQLPGYGPEGEGGDAAGGGDRMDFRDTLISRLVDTGADGIAKMTVHLSDDLTSWHFTAAATTAKVEAGVGEMLVPVSLPLFADVTSADEYLAADRPSIRLRAFGTALRAGDPVVFTVSASSLGLAPREIRSTAFTENWVELPTLTVGRHDVRVSVTAPGRLDATGKPLVDRLVRTIPVVASRLTTTATWYGSADGSLPTVDADGFATYTFTDAGAGRHLAALLAAAEPAGARLDDAIAQEIAIGLLVRRFGYDAASLPPTTLDLDAFSLQAATPGDPSGMNGLNIVPHSGSDPSVAARIAMLAPGTFEVSTHVAVLANIRDDPAPTRELVIASLAGLAALGQDVDVYLRDALGATDLTPTERLHLAFAFYRAGDEANARALERGLLDEYGQRLGPWVRLAVPGGADAISEATALGAVLAAALGDPLAPDMLAYVAENPSREASTTLESIVAIELALERIPTATARIRYTVEGVTKEVAIEPGRSFRLDLGAAQRRTLAVDVVSGSVGLTVAWQRPRDPATIAADATVRLTRSIPEGARPGSIVYVSLRATFTGAALKSDCYEVVEQVPSGLIPTDRWSRSGPGVFWPSSIAGQEVRFCIPFGAANTSAPSMEYAARVLSAGTYAWEPAIIQHPTVTSIVAATSSGSVSIAGK